MPVLQAHASPPRVDTEPYTVVEARNLVRTYGRGRAAHAAVNDVSVTIARGEVVLVSGPSGCGKSTLLSILGGLDRGFSGRLRLFGLEIGHLDDREISRIRGERIGFVFQAFHLLDHLTALENVTAPSLFAEAHRSRRAVEARGRDVLAQVGLADRAKDTPAELSGGQRQRVAVARALYRDPDLLLCDEPTGNLDRRTGEAIIDLFATIHEQLATTLVVVTHEDRMARIATRRLSMLDGSIRS